MTNEDLQKLTKKVVAKYNFLNGSHYKHLAKTNVALVKKCIDMGITDGFLLENVGELKDHYTTLEEYFSAVILKFKNIDKASTGEVDWDAGNTVKDVDGKIVVKDDLVFVRDLDDEEWSDTPVPFFKYNTEYSSYECVSQYDLDNYELAKKQGKEYTGSYIGWNQILLHENIKMGIVDKVGVLDEDEIGLEEEYEEVTGEVVDEKTAVEPQATPQPTITGQDTYQATDGNPQTATPTYSGGSGMDFLAGALADNLMNTVLAKTQQSIDDYVNRTYGTLPKVIKVEKNRVQHTVTGITHEVFEDVLKLVNNEIPVFLIGKAGTGKNVICKQVAESLGLDFYFSNAVTQEYKITGFIDAGGNYHKTQFFDAFTKGGLFFLDEMDASVPEVLIILNAAIANGYFDFPHGKFDAHKDFRVVAAGNTFGRGADYEYTGRNALDSASLDRFATIEVIYSRKIEMALTGNDKGLVNFFSKWRHACDKAGISCVASYRGLSHVSTLENAVGLEKALKYALVKNLTKDDLNIIDKEIEWDGIENQYRKAFKAVLNNARD